MATPSRFELPISSLTGRRVRPLHHGAVTSDNSRITPTAYYRQPDSLSLQPMAVPEVPQPRTRALAAWPAKGFRYR